MCNVSCFVELILYYRIDFFFFPTDVIAGLIRTVAGIQNVSPEKIPMGIIALRGVQNVLGLADTDSHVLRGDRSAVQRQFRQHGQTVHGQ